MYIFYLIILFFRKTFSTPPKKYNIKSEIKKALEFQSQGETLKAIEIYLNILSLKEKIELVNYSLALNNLVVIYYESNEIEKAKTYYEELVQVREELFILDYELYGIDYAYTKVMGVEWFHKSKKELEGVKKLLISYKGIYNTCFLEEKINALEYNQWH